MNTPNPNDTGLVKEFSMPLLNAVKRNEHLGRQLLLNGLTMGVAANANDLTPASLKTSYLSEW